MLLVRELNSLKIVQKKTFVGVTHNVTLTVFVLLVVRVNVHTYVCVCVCVCDGVFPRGEKKQIFHRAYIACKWEQKNRSRENVTMYL